MVQNWFYLIEQASDMSKIKLFFIIYACSLNKTTKTINKLTNEQPRSHFFLTDPLHEQLNKKGRGLPQEHRDGSISGKDEIHVFSLAAGEVRA